MEGQIEGGENCGYKGNSDDALLFDSFFPDSVEQCKQDCRENEYPEMRWHNYFERVIYSSSSRYGGIGVRHYSED